MAMVTDSYAIHYIKSNGVCFTYYRLLWAMIPANTLIWNHYQTLVAI